MLLKNALEQVELADRGGYDYIWATEHHFLEEYAHSSAPEIFLAACSQRTKNVFPLPYSPRTARKVAAPLATFSSSSSIAPSNRSIPTARASRP